jgi:hypothetical protein
MQTERLNQPRRDAATDPRRSFQRPDKHTILALALLVVVAMGIWPRAASSTETLASRSFGEERQQAASGAHARLADTVVIWLSADFPLPANYQPPRIEIVSPMQLAAVRLGGLSASLQARVVSDEQWLEKMRDTVALYEDSSRTIYLREGWTGATPGEMSVLVHEMVHHLQNLAGETFVCPQAREQAAYAAQKKWLATTGLDFFREFETDPMTLMLRTVCSF